MKVVLAREMGMCFGVRDALAAVEAIDRPHDVTILGELVHNPIVVQRLRERGFATLPEGARDAAIPTARALVTAHGQSDRARAALRSRGHEIIDTTCPLVRFAHERARLLDREGYLVVVIGRRGHVEVEGLVGDLDRFAIVEGEADVVRWDAARLGVVCQTTTPPDRARRIVQLIAACNPGSEVRLEDTICGPTRNRQEALDELLDQVEALVVVGGRHSNNTRELAGRAAARGVPAFHVEGPEDLDTVALARFGAVGLTAGTSTLDATIQRVRRALESIAAPVGAEAS